MTVNTSDLDFINIKNKLKTYFKNTSEFKDYDFEASGLSSILDVLAYNSHLNALTANMAINESFLSTSQLRSSVVGHAETLGYFPKSKTAPMAIVDVTILDPNGTSQQEILTSRTEFLTAIDDVGYVFYNRDEYVATKNEDNAFVFSNVKIYEGRERTKTFFADNSIDTVFVIPDENIDTSTMVVKVYENPTADVFTVYKNIFDVATITDDSRVYMIHETPNGYYEIYFGDGNMLGKRPQSGNVIQVDYISTANSDANGAARFNLNAFNALETTVTTISPAAGGSNKESIQEIKINAPRAFATQQRLVTAADYSALIKSNFGQYVRDVIAWGGNDNAPPKFGCVFVSLNFFDGFGESTQEEVKTMIRDRLTNDRSIMSIDTEFVEPQETYLEINAFFNIDSLQAAETVESMQVSVKNLIKTFVGTNLDTFGKTFRRSHLVAEIDDSSNAIINSRVDIKVQQRINLDEEFLRLESLLPEDDDRLPLSSTTQDFTLQFPFALANPDKDDFIITSSVIKFNGENVIIKNKLGDTQLQLVDFNNDVKLKNVGYYEPGSGKVYLQSLTILRDGYVGDSLKISATPSNPSTLRPKRNYIITVDENDVFVRGYID